MSDTYDKTLTKGCHMTHRMRLAQGVARSMVGVGVIAGLENHWHTSHPMGVFAATLLGAGSFLTGYFR